MTGSGAGPRAAALGRETVLLVARVAGYGRHPCSADTAARPHTRIVGPQICYVTVTCA